MTVAPGARREETGIPRATLGWSAALGVVAAFVALMSGHFPIGLGLGAGLLVGSVNGYLVIALMDRNASFVASSLIRLAVVSAVAILFGILLSSVAWSVLIGVAAAQLIMVATSVRQGLRA